MADSVKPWWRRGINVPRGVWAIYFGFVMFGFLSLWDRDYQYWYIIGPLSILVGFALLISWRRRHPEEYRRRRLEAGYPEFGRLSRLGRGLANRDSDN